MPGSPARVPISPIKRDAPQGDPALDRPRLATDMCKNIDLPPSAFAINYPVSRQCLLFSNKISPYFWSAVSQTYRERKDLLREDECMSLSAIALDAFMSPMR